MKEICSQILPLPYSDINTDMILPARYLTTTVKHGLGEHLFTDLQKMDPSFPLKNLKYEGAKIIVTRRNFGCGSSREHAVWSLLERGFQAIIVPSFGDIFYSNAIKNHLLAAILNAEVIEKIFAAEKTKESYFLDIDLEKLTVKLPDETSYSFELGAFEKYTLLYEVDNLNYLLSRMEAIQAFDKKHRKNIFLHLQH